MILHKLSEDILHMKDSTESARRIARLEKYVQDHPHVVLIEHPQDIAKIVSRYVNKKLPPFCSQPSPDHLEVLARPH